MIQNDLQVVPAGGMNTDRAATDPLWELVAFGRDADRDVEHRIERGGFLAPGRGALDFEPGRKETAYGEAARSEGSAHAGSTTGPRSRRRTSAATETGSETYSVERGVSDALGLEEVFRYHPDAEWLGHSSNSAWLRMGVGLFRTVPADRAYLVLELPTRWPRWMLQRSLSPAPVIRAWAFWVDGLAVRAYHENPDGSMCACRPEEWRFGVHPLEDYVGFCVCWIAKALHDARLGRWPGPQHLPPHTRLERNRLDEHCGCGGRRLYGDCCRAGDVSAPPVRLIREKVFGRQAYFAELRRRALEVTPRAARVPG